MKSEPANSSGQRARGGNGHALGRERGSARQESSASGDPAVCRSWQQPWPVGLYRVFEGFMFCSRACGKQWRVLNSVQSDLIWFLKIIFALWWESQLIFDVLHPFSSLIPVRHKQVPNISLSIIPEMSTGQRFTFCWGYLHWGKI